MPNTCYDSMSWRSSSATWGGVAQMDESYEYVDDWVAIACADNSQKIQVTSHKDSAGGESDRNAEASLTLE